MTFASAVMFWNRLKRWKTMPISDRCAASSFSFNPLTCSPSRKTPPPSTGSSRARQRSRVDLPEPDGPMITFTSPRPTSSDARRTTSSPS
jgi:hypothetical protein